MREIRIAICLLFLMLSVGGCLIDVKTPIVANYQKLQTVQPVSSRSDIESMLGTPQSSGLHMLDGNSYELSFYYGFIGSISSSEARCDSGTAFMTYDKDTPVQVLYFTSTSSDPGIVIRKDLPIKKLMQQMTIGKTNIQTVYAALGVPDYKGRRIDKRAGLIHNVAFYDASHMQYPGAEYEKWLLIGFDDRGAIQDVMWVSSMQDDVAEFGKTAPFPAPRQISRTVVTDLLIPMDDPRAFITGGTIDSLQVDALMRTKPTRIEQIRNTIGNPLTLGIKNFKGSSSLMLSGWSYYTMDYKGSEDNYRLSASFPGEPPKESDLGPTYHIVNVAQTRLLIGHDRDGTIREIMWLKPFGR